MCPTAPGQVDIKQADAVRSSRMRGPWHPSWRTTAEQLGQQSTALARIGVSRRLQTLQNRR
jgi:hypothetical protein